MRALFSFFSPGRLAGLALLAPCMALAQNPLSPALANAADPAAHTAALAYQGTIPRPLQAQQLGVQDWRAANNAVSDFPRGHADIVAWEAAQASANANASAVTPALPAAPALKGNPAASQPAAPHGAHHPAMHPQPPLTGQP